jgi:serine protease Do
MPVSDESGQIAFEVPEAWTDDSDLPWSFGGQQVGPGVVVSTDGQAFKDGWKTPGVYVAASPTIAATRSADEILDAERAKFERSCTLVGRESFTRGDYIGRYDLWSGCEGTDTRFLTLVASPDDDSHLVYVQFQAVTEEDLAALDRVLATLEVSFEGS